MSRTTDQLNNRSGKPAPGGRGRIALAALTACVLGVSAVIATAAADGGAAGWTRLGPSALERAEPAAAAVGGSIYVVGGFIGPDTTNKVERYDPAHDDWSVVKPMPLALNHASAVSYGGDLYVLGGYTGGISNPGVPTGGLADASDAFLRYDPQTDSWSPMPPMPIARSAAAAAVVGDRLYVAGGRDRLPTYTTSEGLLKRLDVFDFRTGKWTRGPDMALAREHVGGAALGDAFYVIGGRLALDSTAAVERYLPSEERWERVADMQVAHNGFPAVTVGNRIVVFGGEEPSNAQMRTQNEVTEMYDPATDRWSRLPDMRTPRGAHAGAALGRRVYAIEGIAATPTTSCCVFSNIVEALDIPPSATRGVARRRPRIRLSVAPRRAHVAKTTRFRFRATASANGRRVPVRRARIRFAGRRVRTGRRGRATTVRRFRAPRRYRAIARRRGFRRGSATVRVFQ